MDDPIDQPPVSNPKFGRRKLFYFCLLVLLVLVVLSVLLLNKSSKTTVTNTKPTPLPVATDNSAQVSATTAGFLPSAISVKAGTMVSWTVNGKQNFIIASNPFPNDDSFASLKSPTLSNGRSYHYTFTKAGTYEYHNDLLPSENGEIIVK